MEKRRLGESDLHITPIGFGSWATGGGGWEFGWGAQDDEQSLRAIHRALDLGINWIDTAAVYGLGHSEEVVARALAERRGPRPLVFTKCSLIWGEDREIRRSLKADSLRRECEASLRRLSTDVIDLYQVHWPNPDPDIEEGWATLSALQKEGKVRHLGVSNFSVAQMRRVKQLGLAPIVSLQPPYSAVRPEIETEVLPYCRNENIGVIVYSPMQAGLLSGTMTAERVQHLPADDWRRRAREFTEPRLLRNLRLAELFGRIGARHGHIAGAVAIAWTLRQPAVTGAIVGARGPEQVDGFIGAASFRLGPDEIAEVDRFLRENP